jgi:hypothetical protein
MVRFKHSFDFEKKEKKVEGKVKKERNPVELLFSIIEANRTHMFTLDQENCLKYKSVEFEVTEDLTECKGVTFESLKQAKLSYDEVDKFLFYVDEKGFL